MDKFDLGATQCHDAGRHDIITLQRLHKGVKLRLQRWLVGKHALKSAVRTHSTDPTQTSPLVSIHGTG